MVLRGGVLVEALGLKRSGDCFSIEGQFTWSTDYESPGLLMVIDTRESSVVQLYDPMINLAVNSTKWRQHVLLGLLSNDASRRNVRVFPYECDSKLFSSSSLEERK
jgi:hypothetical protein